MCKYDPVLTGNRIKFCREQKGLTLDNIAVSVGVARSTIQRYEAGTIKRPKLPVIDSIAKILDVNPSWLLNKTDNPGSYHEDTVSKTHDKYLVNNDPELTAYLEELRTRPELRMLFSVTKDASKEDVEKAVAIIEALRKTEGK